jgi:hypothetical protein
MRLNKIGQMWPIDVSLGSFGVPHAIIADWCFWTKREPTPKWHAVAAVPIADNACAAKFRMVIGKPRRLSQRCGVTA